VKVYVVPPQKSSVCGADV